MYLSRVRLALPIVAAPGGRTFDLISSDAVALAVIEKAIEAAAKAIKTLIMIGLEYRTLAVSASSVEARA